MRSRSCCSATPAGSWRTGRHGTTLLLQEPGAVVELRYGPGSAAAHEALGVRRLAQVPSGLRDDADRLQDRLAVPERRAG